MGKNSSDCCSALSRKKFPETLFSTTLTLIIRLKFIVIFVSCVFHIKHLFMLEKLFHASINVAISIEGVGATPNVPIS